MRSVTCSLALLIALTGFAAWPANDWKLVLKNGTVVVCDGAPLIIDGVYTFTGKDGKPGTVDAGQVDREKTDRANTVDKKQWRAVGGSARQQETVETAERASADIMTLRDADFSAQVLESKTPVLVEFWATWCGYCRRFEPTVKAIAGEYAGQIRVGKLDIDLNPATARRYGISGTPTVLLFKEGRVVGAIDGAADKAEVAQMLRAHL